MASTGWGPTILAAIFSPVCWRRPRVARGGDGLFTAGSGAGASRWRLCRTHGRARRSATMRVADMFMTFLPLFCRFYGRRAGDRVDQRDYRYRPVSLGVRYAWCVALVVSPAPARVFILAARLGRKSLCGFSSIICRRGGALAAGSRHPRYRSYDAASPGCRSSVSASAPHGGMGGND